MTKAGTNPWAVILIAALAIFPAVLFVTGQAAAPWDGARLEPGASSINEEGVVVSVLRPQTDGLLDGDLVTVVDGRSLEAWAKALFQPGAQRPDWQPGEQVIYTVRRAGSQQQIQVQLGPFGVSDVLRRNWGTILFALVFHLIASFVFLRRPRSQAGQVLFLSASFVLSSTSWSFGLTLGDIVSGMGFWLFKVTSFGFYAFYWVSMFHFAAIFPKPLPFFERHPRLLPLSYLGVLVFITLWVLLSRSAAVNTLDWLRRWTPAEGIIAGFFLALTLITITRQYRINTRGATRQQIRWVVWAGLVAGGCGLFLYILPGVFGWPGLNPNLMGVIVLVFPLAIAAAILRHNLFEIDQLMNRTLVYGTLIVLTGGIYLLVVAAFGLFLQTQGNWVVSLLAAGLVAILVQPLRERLVHWVNRRMYGARDEPFEVLARLGRQLETSLPTQTVLPTIVETIAQTLHLPYVALSVAEGTEEKIVASYGRPSEGLKPFPLLNQGETVGRLLVAQRAQDEEFTRAEMKLLDSIARQVGAAVHNVTLARDLQQSRQRLISAQEEERRRLRRDLHDGLGPRLAAHLLKIGLARAQLRQTPAVVERYLLEMEDDTQGILEEVRRLVYDLRPPLLDHLGLAGAIRATVEQFNSPASDSTGLRVELALDDKTPALPAAVEVALFRILQEALTNVERHARATCCQVALTFEREALLIIRDNGRGFPSAYTPGVGLHSMRERAAELGGKFELRKSKSGGAEIRVTIPYQPAGNV